MLLSRIAPAGALLLLSTITIAGCAVRTSSEDTTSSAEALTSETFTLYSDVEPDLSGRCDRHTILTLSSGRESDIKEPFSPGGVLHAHLFNEVVGSCKLYVDPDPRDYALLFSGDECGSMVYAAATTIDGKVRDITVTDNRKRFCKDIVPRIVVEEREESGEIRTLESGGGARTIPVS